MSRCVKTAWPDGIQLNTALTIVVGQLRRWVAVLTLYPSEIGASFVSCSLTKRVHFSNAPLYCLQWKSSLNWGWNTFALCFLRKIFMQHSSVKIFTEKSFFSFLYAQKRHSSEMKWEGQARIGSLGCCLLLLWRTILCGSIRLGFLTSSIASQWIWLVLSVWLRELNYYYCKSSF